MTHALAQRSRALAGEILKNPHFWVVVALSTVLLLVYQSWPWREFMFEQGVWRFFPWLSRLEYLVTEVEIRYHVFGVLFFVPIVYGSLAMSWPGGVFSWLLALIWVLPTLVKWSSETLLVSLALLLLPALLVAIVTGETALA